MTEVALTTPKSQKSRLSVIDDTPDARVGQEATQLDAKGKARVDAAGPNGARCTIQNSPATSAVEYAHVFPRRFMRKDDPEDLLGIIEYNWNMKPYTLNLDTRLNVIKLSSTLHSLHDNPPSRGAWVLMPPTEIIEMHYQSVTTKRKNVVLPGPFSMPDTLRKNSRSPISQPSYKYDFVPFDETMRHSVVYVQPTADPTEETVLVRTWPFDKLSPVYSHLHYRFAILEIGRRLRPHARQLVKTRIDPDIAAKIRMIYMAWTTDSRDPSNPIIARTNGEEDQSEGGDSDNGTEGTGKRSRRSNTRSAKRPNQGSPSDRGKRSRKGKSEAGQDAADHDQSPQDCDCGVSCLSGETLNEHDASIGMQSWDKNRIDDWVGGVIGERHGVADVVV